MKIKEIRIGLKRVYNYQTYEYAEVIEIEENDNVDEVIEKAYAKARKILYSQIKTDFKSFGGV